MYGQMVRILDCYRTFTVFIMLKARMLKSISHLEKDVLFALQGKTSKNTHKTSARNRSPCNTHSEQADSVL